MLQDIIFKLNIDFVKFFLIPFLDFMVISIDAFLEIEVRICNLFVLNDLFFYFTVLFINFL